jgi:hypothetical protein
MLDDTAESSPGIELVRLTDVRVKERKKGSRFTYRYLIILRSNSLEPSVSSLSSIFLTWGPGEVKGKYARTARYASTPLSHTIKTQ